ncbi:MAG: transglycosylase domain-containing protein, partial [Acidobacteriota bacterium]|nr:transglycosylase domain-containing protein [Acidobacteriota bacterium]
MGAKPAQSKRRGRKKHTFLRVILVLGLVIAFVAAGIAGFYYRSYSEMIDDRLSGKRIQGESLLFTAPKRISVGQTLDPERLVTYLKNSGYSATGGGEATGRITRTGASIQIQPAANSYFDGEHGVRIDFDGTSIRQLTSLDSGKPLLATEIEPELITSIFGRDREKRRALHYSEFPQVFISAVLSAEDKRFFDHPGIDFIRGVGAALHDVRRGSKAQGASTITMQVARSFFFSTKREWRRKVKETFMAVVLEH